MRDNINIAEYLILKRLKKLKKLKKCKEDINTLNCKESTLLERLQLIVNHYYCRISYTEAITVFTSQNHSVEWVIDIKYEYERYLVEHFCLPIILLDYPAQVKAFYMRLNEYEKTVSSMYVLFPIIGGSQREERYELLLNRMQSRGVYEKLYWWDLDTRPVPHCVFDRLVQFITVMLNIRDVIPFPRTPKNAEF